MVIYIYRHSTFTFAEKMPHKTKNLSRITVPPYMCLNSSSSSTICINCLHKHNSATTLNTKLKPVQMLLVLILWLIGVYACVRVNLINHHTLRFILHLSQHFCILHCCTYMNQNSMCAWRCPHSPLPPGPSAFCLSLC